MKKKFLVLFRIILIVFSLVNIIIFAICIKEGVGNLLFNTLIVVIWLITLLLQIRTTIYDINHKN